MRDEKRAARAEEIETAAYGVLEAKGYDGLTMLAVARAAKASNEMLYRWYGDKQGLIEALIRSMTASGPALMRPPHMGFGGLTGFWSDLVMAHRRRVK